MSTLDVLKLIKSAIEAQVAHQIYSEDSDIFIPTSTGTKQFVATAKTVYRRKDRKSKEFLTVGGLYDLLQQGLHTGSQYTDYKKNSLNKEKVGVLDWYELKRYLTGESDTTKQVHEDDNNNNSRAVNSHSSSSTGSSSSSSSSTGSHRTHERNAASATSSTAASSMSSSAQSSLIMAAEKSLKRKRELIEASGMTEEAATACASRARSQESSQVTRQNILDDVQADYSEVKRAMESVTRSTEKSTKKKEEKKKVERVPKYPIILVSESTSKAKISMWNVLQFLSEGRYVSVKDAKKNHSGGTKEPKALFLKRNNGVTYRVLPVGITGKGPKYWSPNDYSRVVGLFADGSTWAYKGWPTGIVEIFNNTAGFHVYYIQEKPHANCQQWMCDKITIDKNKRHHDAVAVAKIWQAIDSFVKHHYDEYLPENWKDPQMK